MLKNDRTRAQLDALLQSISLSTVGHIGLALDARHDLTSSTGN